MAKSSKKKKTAAYRFINDDTGTHYTVRLSKTAYEKLGEKQVKKYDPKLRKHVVLKLTKKVK